MVKFVGEQCTEEKKLVPSVEVENNKAYFKVQEEGGERKWIICEIGLDGKMVLFNSLPEDIGLQVDNEGRILCRRA